MGWGRRIRKDRGGSGFVGCMSGMLQLFDFHQLAAFERFTAISASSSSSSSSLPSTTRRQGGDTFFCNTGIEAPRNSLEVLPCRNVKVASLGEHDAEDSDDDDIDFEVSTGSKSCEQDDQKSKDGFKSKNPSVVARLMGLEILPDVEMINQRGKEGDYFAANDSSRGRSCKANCKPSLTTEHNLKLRALQKRSDNIFIQQERTTATTMLCWSLPESPRISSGRWSDVEHHRLSLQINKENHPPSTNNNAVNTCSSSPSSSLFKNYSDTQKINHSSSSKPTSPRLVLSPNSPRLLKTREEKGYTNRQSNPSCSPKLRCKADEITTAAAAAKPKLQISPPNGSSSPRFSRAMSTTRLSSNPSTTGGQPTTAESDGSRPTTTRFMATLTNRSNKPKLEAMRVVGEVMPKKDNRRETNCDRRKCTSSPVKKGKKPFFGDALLPRHGNHMKGSAAPHSSRLVVVSTLTKDDQHCSSNRQTCTPPPASGSSPKQRQKSMANDEQGSVDIIQDGAAEVVHSRNIGNSAESPKKLTTLSSLLEREKGVDRWETTGDSGTKDLFLYPFIKKILESTGVTSETNVSFTNWYSPSHPLDPIILTQMLHDNRPHVHHHDHDGVQHGHHHARMSDIRSNRKLVFDLVDELLRERLRSHLSMKPWIMAMHDGSTNAMVDMTGKKLLDDVWMDVNLFPPERCRIVEDVDAIVSNDLGTNHHSSILNMSSSETFSETILFRIGSDIGDLLVSELVVDMLSL